MSFVHQLLISHFFLLQMVANLPANNKTMYDSEGVPFPGGSASAVCKTVQGLSIIIIYGQTSYTQNIDRLHFVVVFCHQYPTGELCRYVL